MRLIAFHECSIIAVRMEGSADASNLTFVLFLLDGMRVTLELIAIRKR